MKKDSLDDTNFLGLFTHLNQTSVRIATIRLDCALHVRLRTIALVVFLLEQLDVTSGNSHNRHSYLDVLRKVLDQCTSEIIYRT